MRTEFFLIGDSHSGILARVARDRGLAFKGGPLGGGVRLHQSFFTVEGGNFILTDDRQKPRQDLFTDLLRYDGPILSTVGFDSHMFANRFAMYLDQWGATSTQFSQNLFRQCVIDGRPGVLEFYQTLKDHGRDVYFTCSPQRVEAALMPHLKRYEAVMIDLIRETGATFVDVRPAIMVGDSIRAEYAAEDHVHGSDAWASLIFTTFDEILGRTPEIA